MLKLPLVTFVVTSYNYEKYILQTLDSIKNQSYGNFEIIIVDDASSDNSCQVVEDFIAENQDLKITLYKLEKNQGQLAAMMKGLENANGVFVSFVDSDDILLPDYAKTHLRVHLESSVAFTSCAIAEIDENDEVHTLNSNASPNCTDFECLFDGEKAKYEIVKKTFGGWWWSPNSSAMFRKASIEILLNYKNTDKWKICPDKFLFNFAHLIGGSVNIFAPLTGYRRHSKNAGNCSLVTGDKRLHSDYITKINIENNLKIRPETVKFLWENRNTLGKRNTARLILTVLLSSI